MPLLDLPTDVLYIILSYGTVRSAGRVSSLSRKGNQIVKAAPIWIQFAQQDKQTLFQKKRDRSFDHNSIYRDAAVNTVAESISYLKRRSEDKIWTQGSYIG
jgi:hypothetical protein